MEAYFVCFCLKSNRYANVICVRTNALSYVLMDPVIGQGDNIQHYGLEKTSLLCFHGYWVREGDTATD